MPEWKCLDAVTDVFGINNNKCPMLRTDLIRLGLTTSKNK